MKQQPEPELPSNFFVQTVNELAQGDLAPMLSDDLASLVKEVRNQGRKGTLTLKITVEPAGSNGKVEVKSQVDLKMPKPDAGISVFFSTELGQLLRHDPAQRQLPFGEDAAAPRRAAASNQ